MSLLCVYVEGGCSEYFPQFLEMTSYISPVSVMGPLAGPRARGRLGADSIELGWGFVRASSTRCHSCPFPS